MDQSSSTAGHGDRNEEAAALTATVLTAVERQLTRYFSAINQRVDDSLKTAEALRDEVRGELTRHIPHVESSLAAQRSAAEAYQQALQRALDDRLGEVALHHATRLAEFDARLSALAAQPAGVSPEDVLQIRQAMREDIWKSIAPVTERLDSLSDAHKRTDEQANKFVQHVNNTTTTLVNKIDEGDQRVATQLEALIAASRDAGEARAAATEARLGELETETAARAQALADDITAVGDLANEASAAASARLVELEKRIGTIGLDLATMATKVEGIDQDAIEDLKSQMSAAIGEAMLVRIELDRVVAATDEKLDKTAVRLGEIEALLTDEMDVGAAVQLERLDELERAVMMLDPDQFVRKDELLTGSSASAVNSASAVADISRREAALDGGTDPENNGNGSHDSSYDDGHSEDALSASEAWS